MISSSVMSLWSDPNSNRSPFLARLSYAARIPVTLVTTALDTVLLGLFTSLNVLTLGKVERIHEKNKEQTGPISILPPHLFYLTLNVFNPRAELARKKSGFVANRPANLTNEPEPKVVFGNFGIISEVVKNLFTRATDSLRKSRSIVKSQLLTRFTFAIAIPVLIVCKIVDLAIGILAAVAAIVAFGTSKTLNTWAYVGLDVISLIPSIPKLVIRVITA